MDAREKVEHYKRKLQNDPSNPEVVYKLAKAYRDLNFLDEAIKFFQLAIELDGHHIKSYLELANLLFAVDRIDKAVEVCQLGIDYNPESSDIYYLLEQLYEILGEYELASQTLEDLINIDDGYTKAYEALGRLSIFQNRLDEALIWLNRLIEIDPKNVNAFIYLANINRKKRNFGSAVKNLESALAIDPDNLDVYNDLGLIYLESCDFEKARDHFEYVLTKDPDYSFAFDNLGVIYRKTREYEKAEEMLKKSLSMNLQAWTYNELALVYTEMGRYKESVENSKKALTVDSNYAFAYDNLGAVYRKLGFYDKAEKALLSSVELKPDDSWTYNQLGLLYYEKAKYISARSNFVKSSELDNTHFWPRINIANCYLKEKNYPQAEQYISELIERYPKVARVYLLKSKLYFLLDNFDEAIKWGEMSVYKDQDDALSLVNLAMIYRELDDFEKASELFAKSFNTSRPKDSSVYLESAIYHLYLQEYEQSFMECVKAREVDELNHNIYCLMALIENSSDYETRLLDYIREIEKDNVDDKDIFLCYANSFLELGQPEESEKFFALALKVDPEYPEAQYGLSQAYYLMRLYDKSLEYAFFNTDNSENIELSSYCNAVVALNYLKMDNMEKYYRYKDEAQRLNPTICKEYYQKYKLRRHLRYYDRRDFSKNLFEMFEKE